MMGYQASAFRACGYAGFFLSFVQSMLLARHLGLSQLTLLGVTGTVILTFYILMIATKILADGELIIYYHHEIAVVATTGLFLRLTGNPVLSYLDILVLGLGLFLAFGRIGCFMVGCCHGRPCGWGVCYGKEHAEAGFPDYLVGVRLFPIQLFESVLALCIVGSGLIVLFHSHRPGAVLLYYVIAYGCGRFCLEFFRGDAARRYFLGFSEAQWTSLLLAFAALAGEYVRLLPESHWHRTAAALMLLCMVGITIWRRLDRLRRFELLHPFHVREISLALQHLNSLRREPSLYESSRRGPVVHVVRTSPGYRISAGLCPVASGVVEHFSLSLEGRTLRPRAARILSQLLAHLTGKPDSCNVIQRSSGVFHILFVFPSEGGGQGHSPGASSTQSIISYSAARWVSLPFPMR